MTANESPALGDVFELLNRWRHLPFYSLETRAAPFFAVFLRDVLRAKFGTEMHETVIPEFPLRIGSLYADEERGELHPKPGRNQSYNVDYVAFAKDKSTAYLVELKTDMGSKRSKQDDYLCKAQGTVFRRVVKGVRPLAKASSSKQKYVHLLHLLSKLELAFMPDDELYKMSFPKVVRGWTEATKKLEIEEKNSPKTKVVFIQPIPDPKPTKDTKNKYDFNYIYFDEVANIVQRHGDLGCIFANFLRQWVEEAGSPDPRDIHRT